MRHSRIALAVLVLLLVGTLGPAAAPRGVGGVLLADLTPEVMAAAVGTGTDPAPPAGRSGMQANVVTATAPGITYRMYSGVGFATRSSTTTYGYPNAGGKYTTAGIDWVTRPLDLPQGARITEIAWYYTDTDAAVEPAFALTAYAAHAPATSDLDITSAPATSAAGIHVLVRDLTATNVVVDNTATSYNLLALTNSTTNSVVFYGARIGYLAPAAQYVPITPARVFDSRFPAFGGKLTATAARTLSVADQISVSTGAVTQANVVPAGARAVTYNLTITDTTGNGFLALAPGTSTTISASAINWTAANMVLANGGTATLGSGAGDRRLTIITRNGTTHAVLDITGYFVAP